MAEPSRRGARYARDRLSLRGIGAGAALIAAAIVVSALAAYAVTHLGNGARPAPRWAARSGPPPPIAAPVSLQPTPGQDIADFAADKSRSLETYGWVDREGAIAHIPIERAMAILAREGAAARKTP
ncbi:MAG TPA: hypothetical protein VMN79_04080 [Casimicrobiaceae bacterium]|nr:hypothetical protein [Casimicrobiaceae bacterium]